MRKPLLLLCLAPLFTLSACVPHNDWERKQRYERNYSSAERERQREINQVRERERYRQMQSEQDRDRLRELQEDRAQERNQRFWF